MGNKTWLAVDTPPKTPLFMRELSLDRARPASNTTVSVMLPTVDNRTTGIHRYENVAMIEF